MGSQKHCLTLITTDLLNTQFENCTADSDALLDSSNSLALLSNLSILLEQLVYVLLRRVATVACSE